MQKFFDLYEERAAIKQFDGKMPRPQAEKEALDEVLQELKKQEGVSEKDLAFFKRKVAESDMALFLENSPQKTH